MPNFVGPPFPDPPGASTIPFPDPGEQPQTADVAVGVFPDPQVPNSPVIIQSSPYWEYAVSKIVFDGSGLILQVPAGPIGAPADVLRSSAPYGSMVVRWISRRRGAKPVIPSRDLGDANVVYIRGWRSGAIAGRLLSGEPCTQIEGEYVYGLRLPYSENDPIYLGAMPYEGATGPENTIQPSDYSKTIAGPNTPPAGAPTDQINY